MIRKPDLGALIEANRAVNTPSLEDRERNRRRLVRRIGASVVLGTGVLGTRAAAAEISTGATPPFAGASTLAASGWAKWLAVSALVAAGGTGAGVFVVRHVTVSRSPAASLAVPVPAASSVPSVVSPALPAPSLAAAASPATTRSPDGAIQEEETGVRAHVRGRSAKAPSGGAPTEGLARELDLLRSARRAIDDGSPTAALTLLDRYEAEFARGASLRTEYEATRVLALCAADRTTAAAQARDHFLETHPGSPLADRVRTACGVH